MRCHKCVDTAKTATISAGGGWMQTIPDRPEVNRNKFYLFMRGGYWLAGDVFPGSPKEQFQKQGSLIAKMLADDIGISDYSVKFVAGKTSSLGSLILSSYNLEVNFIPVYGMMYYDPDYDEEYRCWLSWDELIMNYQKSCFKIIRYMREIDWNKKVRQAISNLPDVKAD